MRHSERGQWVRAGLSCVCLDLANFPNFHELPTFTQIPKDRRAMSNRGTPKTPKNKCGAARLPAGFKWCGNCGFNVGCGLIKSPKTRRMHAIKEMKFRKGRINKMTRHIRQRSLTLQLLERQAGLLVDILKKSMSKVNNEDHLNTPRELHDERVPMDNR